MPGTLDHLEHIVVVMMSGRSFDHMLGGLKAQDPRIDGLIGVETNPDASGEMIPVQPLAEFQGQLDVDPDHHFAGVDLQIFGGSPSGSDRIANMQGFVKSYNTRQADVGRSHRIMYYFRPERLPVLTTLATKYAVFNSWFASVPGPMIPNRSFAHYGTSFGHLGMDSLYEIITYKSIYQRM